MKKLNNTEAELKKSVAYKKKRVIEWSTDIPPKHYFSMHGILSCGALQGSIEPIFVLSFALFVNDLPQALSETGSYSYVCVSYKYKDF